MITLEDGLDDPVLIRALRRGDDRGLVGLVQRHFESIYGAMRMTLPTQRQAEIAARETFIAAARRAAEATRHDDVRSWLLGISLEQVANREPRPIPMESRRASRSTRLTLRDGPRKTAAGDPPDPKPEAETAEPEPDPGEALAATRDEALAAMVRTLELETRQAVVLTVVCGLGDAEAGRALGCPARQIERLRMDGLLSLRARLADQAVRREALRRELSDTNPYDLVAAAASSVPGNGKGKGHGADIDRFGHVRLTPPPELNIFKLMRQALKRILDRMRDEEHKLDDEIGGGGQHKALDPTPGQKPFERPKATPSIVAYTKPESSIGTASYRMPKGTPSTARLSNRSRPAVAQANAWASARRTGR